MWKTCWNSSFGGLWENNDTCRGLFWSWASSKILAGILISWVEDEEMVCSFELASSFQDPFVFPCNLCQIDHPPWWLKTGGYIDKEIKIFPIKLPDMTSAFFPIRLILEILIIAFTVGRLAKCMRAVYCVLLAGIKKLGLGLSACWSIFFPPKKGWGSRSPKSTRW